MRRENISQNHDVKFQGCEKENTHDRSEGLERKDAETKHELTLERLRAYKGFEFITEEEAAHIIYSIKELSIVLYQYYLTHKPAT